MFLIYISGIDGCGKTTQAGLLVDLLKENGFDAQYAWLRWEPSLRKLINLFRASKTKPTLYCRTGNIEAENTEQNDWLRFKRKILVNPILKKLWLTYACADYLAAYKKRFNNVTANVLVIDRYVDDFILDQSINFNIPPGKTDLLKNNIFLKRFHYPDMNIIIDIPAQEGYTRKSDGTPLSYLEAREKYYQALTGNNTLHLDGLKSIAELAAHIFRWVLDKLESKQQ